MMMMMMMIIIIITITTLSSGSYKSECSDMNMIFNLWPNIF